MKSDTSSGVRWYFVNGGWHLGWTQVPFTMCGRERGNVTIGVTLDDFFPVLATSSGDTTCPNCKHRFKFWIHEYTCWRLRGDT